MFSAVLPLNNGGESPIDEPLAFTEDEGLPPIHSILLRSDRRQVQQSTRRPLALSLLAVKAPKDVVPPRPAAGLVTPAKLGGASVSFNLDNIISEGGNPRLTDFDSILAINGPPNPALLTTLPNCVNCDKPSVTRQPPNAEQFAVLAGQRVMSLQHLQQVFGFTHQPMEDSKNSTHQSMPEDTPPGWIHNIGIQQLRQSLTLTHDLEQQREQEREHRERVEREQEWERQRWEMERWHHQVQRSLWESERQTLLLQLQSPRHDGNASRMSQTMHTSNDGGTADGDIPETLQRLFDGYAASQKAEIEAYCQQWTENHQAKLVEIDAALETKFESWAAQHDIAAECKEDHAGPQSKRCGSLTKLVLIALLIILFLLLVFTFVIVFCLFFGATALTIRGPVVMKTSTNVYWSERHAFDVLEVRNLTHVAGDIVVGEDVNALSSESRRLLEDDGSVLPRRPNPQLMVTHDAFFNGRNVTVGHPHDVDSTALYAHGPVELHTLLITGPATLNRQLTLGGNILATQPLTVNGPSVTVTPTLTALGGLRLAKSNNTNNSSNGGTAGYWEMGMQDTGRFVLMNSQLPWLSFDSSPPELSIVVGHIDIPRAQLAVQRTVVEDLQIKGRLIYNSSVSGWGVNGDAQLEGNLVVTEGASVKGNIVVNGTSQFWGTMQLGDPGGATALNVSGPAFFQHPITLNNNTVLNGPITALQPATFRSSLLASLLQVEGPAMLAGNVTFQAPITANAPALFTSSVVFTTSMLANGSLTVAGPARFDSGMTADSLLVDKDVGIKGTVSVTGGLRAEGPVQMGEDLQVTGRVEVTGNSTFKSAVEVAGPVSVSGSLVISGQSTLGNVTSQGTLRALSGLYATAVDVAGNGAFAGQLNVGGLFIVGGPTELSSGLLRSGTGQNLTLDVTSSTTSLVLGPSANTVEILPQGGRCTLYAPLTLTSGSLEAPSPEPFRLTRGQATGAGSLTMIKGQAGGSFGGMVDIQAGDGGSQGGDLILDGGSGDKQAGAVLIGGRSRSVILGSSAVQQVVSIMTPTVEVGPGNTTVTLQPRAGNGTNAMPFVIVGQEGTPGSGGDVTIDGGPGNTSGEVHIGERSSAVHIGNGGPILLSGHTMLSGTVQFPGSPAMQWVRYNATLEDSLTEIDPGISDLPSRLVSLSAHFLVHDTVKNQTYALVDARDFAVQVDDKISIYMFSNLQSQSVYTVFLNLWITSPG